MKSCCIIRSHLVPLLLFHSLPATSRWCLRDMSSLKTACRVTPSQSAVVKRGKSIGSVNPLYLSLFSCRKFSISDLLHCRTWMLDVGETWWIQRSMDLTHCSLGPISHTACRSSYANELPIVFRHALTVAVCLSLACCAWADTCTILVWAGHGFLIDRFWQRCVGLLSSHWGVVSLEAGASDLGLRG
jgi:hypothetical protein